MYIPSSTKFEMIKKKKCIPTGTVVKKRRFFFKFPNLALDSNYQKKTKFIKILLQLKIKRYMAKGINASRGKTCQYCYIDFMCGRVKDE